LKERTQVTTELWDFHSPNRNSKAPNLVVVESDKLALGASPNNRKQPHDLVAADHLSLSMNDELDFRLKVAMVTGGSQGIGRSITTKLAERGSRVYFISRRKADGEMLQNALQKKGYSASYFEGDVSQPQTVKGFVSSVVNHEGTVDFLINNAGQFHTRPLEDETDQSFTDIVNVNLRGYFNTIREVIPVMKRKKSGVIVNVASNSAHVVPDKFSALYCMTKGGVLSLTRAVADELAEHNIRVVSVSPGNTATTMTTKAIDNETARRGVDKRVVTAEYERACMLKRMAAPEEIADVVLFLLSNMAKYITATDILVDGGQAAKA
jgi:NAD(P)-dependent dehydrogenase (short-subunit alcohol dehydrogenase family)